MGILSGRSVIVTGASRGIGAAAAEAMAAEGGRVMLLARSGAALAAVAQRITGAGGEAMAMPCDIADYAQLAAAAARTLEAFGAIDVLVNNGAVIDPIGPLARSDPDEWARAADINFKGIYFGMRAVLPAMRAQGAGVILNMGSGAAHNPLEGWSHYCAAKAGTFMLTRCAHLENRGQGIRVTSLSPGTVATDMQRRIKASGINPVSQMEFDSHAPVSAPARALVWLATDAAAEFGGVEVSLRDPEIRTRIGLD